MFRSSSSEAPTGFARGNRRDGRTGCSRQAQAGSMTRGRRDKSRRPNTGINGSVPTVSSAPVPFEHHDLEPLLLKAFAASGQGQRTTR